MVNKPLKQLKILGVKVTSTSKNEVLDFVVSSLKKKHKFFITTPNPEIVLLAQEDKELASALNSADVALPDGIGLVWATQFLNLGGLERITGRAMFEDLLKFANRNKLKIFLLGATKTANSASIVKIKKNYPNVIADGRHDLLINNKGHFVSKKYRKVHNDINNYTDVIKHINKFKPDILFIALGAPKQEKWVYHNLDKLGIGGAMVIGGTLDTFSGKLTPAPFWVSSVGFEWLWRVIQEPARLPRIFRATLVFPLKILQKKAQR